MPINRTSFIRSGFHFQDLYALELCGYWMLHGNDLDWIRFEAIPIEIDSDTAFYLDDILIRLKSGRCLLYQLKHTEAENTREWHLQHLTRRKRLKSGGFSPSYLGKWIDSIAALDGADFEAHMVTDGTAGQDILSCLKDGKLDLSALNQNAPDFLATLYQEVPDARLVERFLNAFRFGFLGVNLKDYQTQVYRELHTNLGATESGINSLLLSIKEECRQQHTLRLTLADLQARCEFDRPRPLDQRFIVPTDFQLFDQQTDKDLVDSLSATEGGIKVLYGKPGSGKSTYLSVLAAKLQKKGCMVVRHHYFLSPTDPDLTSRLESERVIEALKASFKAHPDELGSLDMRNSSSVSLSDFLNAAIRSQAAKGNPVIVILDGLDHVPREHGDDRELQAVLRELLIPQQGVWLVLGMQPQVSESLPDSVFARAPKQEWIEVTGLKEPAVAAIVRKNKYGFTLPHDDRSSYETNSFLQLVHRLFEITEGNPLHLHYSLQQLKGIARDRPLFEHSCSQLVPYGGHIQRYYESLWRGLTTEAKVISITLAAIDFAMTKPQAVDCFTSMLGGSAAFLSARGELDHLLSWQVSRVSAYHSSFQQFVKSTDEFIQQERPIREQLLAWLKTSRHENLNWSVGPLLAYELGDMGPLAPLGKEWLVEALCTPRDQSAISAQLNAATTYAFHQGDWDRNIRLGWLEHYRRNAVDLEDDLFNRLWDEALYSAQRDLNDFQLQAIDSPQIVSLLRQLEQRFGDFSRVDEAIEVLNARHWHKTISFSITTSDNYSIPAVTPLLIQIVSHDRQHRPKQVWDYICRITEQPYRVKLLLPYVDELLKTGQWDKTRELLRLRIPKGERISVLDQCAKADLEDRYEHFSSVIAAAHKRGNRSLFIDLYLILHGKQLRKLQPLPDASQFPMDAKEYRTPESEAFVLAAKQAFIAGIAHTLTGKEEAVTRWANQANHWSHQIGAAMAHAGVDVAKAIQSKHDITCNLISDRIACVPVLKWPEDRPLHELQTRIPEVLSYIYQHLIVLRRYCGQATAIKSDEVDAMLATRHYGESYLLRLLVEHGEALLDQGAFRQFIDRLEAKNRDLIQELANRSERYLDLAVLARYHGDTVRRTRLFRSAANCFVGYRSHKDLFLDQAIDGLEELHHLHSDKVRGWIEDIAPMVEHIKEYTDGDETRYIPLYLAGLLATVDPPALRKYYFHNAEIEDLSFAEDLFRYVVRSLDYANSADRALAGTALDKSSWEELKRLASSDQNAQTVVTGVREVFGDIRHEERDYTSPPLKSEPPQDLAAVEPNELVSRIKREKTPWDQRAYAEAWADVHLSTGPPRYRAQSAKAILRYIETQPLDDVSSRLLDLLVPVVIIEDREHAFRLLCQAQLNGSGWSPYYHSDLKEAHARWHLVQTNFPDRYREFLMKSIYGASRPLKDKAGPVMPIKRVSMYLAMFNDKELAETVVGAAVNVSKALMCDMQFERPAWLQCRDVSVTEVLLQRLLWPSPLIRERAATGIAGLLASPSTQIETASALKRWIDQHQLESEVVLALLPVWLCCQSSPQALTEHLLQEIVDTIVIRSLSIELLVLEINRVTGHSLVLKSDPQAPVWAPTGYHRLSEFDKYRETYLPPVYTEFAREIEGLTGIDFMNHWSTTIEEILAVSPALPSWNSNHYFCGTPTSPVLTGFALRKSEVFRSAFIRVIGNLQQQGLLEDTRAYRYLTATVPMDLSLWPVNPQRCPDWWPRKTAAQTKVDGLQAIGLEVPMRTLLDPQRPNVIAALEGAITPSEGWGSDTPSGSIKVTCFVYRIVGSILPSADEIAAVIDQGRYAVGFSKNPVTNLHFDWLADSGPLYLQKVVKVGDMEIAPVAVFLHTPTIALWQWYRARAGGLLVLAPQWRRDLTLIATPQEWQYLRGEQLVARSVDWTEGVAERHYLTSVIPRGTYLEIDREFLENLAGQTGGRLGYLVTTTTSFSHFPGSDSKTIETNELIGVSQLIVP
jgi:hypothetical protein